MRHMLALSSLMLAATAMAQSLVSPAAMELARSEQNYVRLFREHVGCDFIDTQNDKAQSMLFSLGRKHSASAKEAARNGLADVEKLRTQCQDAELSRVRADAMAKTRLYSERRAREIGFKGWLLTNDVEGLARHGDPGQEGRLEAIAEKVFRDMDGRPCPSGVETQPETLVYWHAFLLQHGYVCTVKEIKKRSQVVNERNNFQNAQAEFDALKTMSLPELKKMFRSVWADEIKAKTAKLALLPQLSYENGVVGSTFPYSLFLDVNEKTNYSYLRAELGKLGMQATVIQRNSLASMEEQVAQTERGLARLKSPHIVLSRSMGAMVMNTIKARAESGMGQGLQNVRSWIDMGGTPGGSVIADYKSRPDFFYEVVYGDGMRASSYPLCLIALDPRIPDHIADTAYKALDRGNLPTMTHWTRVPMDPASTLPVLNLVFLAPGFERATSGVDPVYTHMLMYGPTEGSSPLARAFVDTRNSARIFYDLDHLAFWKLTPQEGFALYLRTLISAKKMGFKI